MSLALVHLVLGALERLFFARMAASSAKAGVLIHSMLCALSALLFFGLRLVRSHQSSAEASSRSSSSSSPGRAGAPPHVRPPLQTLARLAFLDASHSLLAIVGAWFIAGSMQALLLQAALPVSVLIVSFAGQRHIADVQRAGAAVVVGAEAVLLLQPFVPWDEIELTSVDHAVHRETNGSVGVPSVFEAAAAAAEHGDSRAAAAAASHREAIGRWLFFAGVVFGVLSTTHKRATLSRRPTDLLVLNSWLSLMQLLVGIVVGPILLLAVHEQPLHETFSAISKAINCWTAGLNDEGSVSADTDRCSDALETLHILVLFFTTTTVWSGLSYGLLRVGGEKVLNACSALILPVTIFAFTRPFVRPLLARAAWLAPPEPLQETTVGALAVLSVGLALYHTSPSL